MGYEMKHDEYKKSEKIPESEDIKLSEVPMERPMIDEASSSEFASPVGQFVSPSNEKQQPRKSKSDVEIFNQQLYPEKQTIEDPGKVSCEKDMKAPDVPMKLSENLKR